MTSPQEYLLKLTIDDVNTVLRALGRLPFEEVYAIIHKIHQQAGEQGSTNTGSASMEVNKPT